MPRHTDVTAVLRKQFIAPSFRGFRATLEAKGLQSHTHLGILKFLEDSLRFAERLSFLEEHLHF